jgi:type I restriction enzyme S subunit
MRQSRKFNKNNIEKIPQDWEVKSIDEIKSKVKNALAMGPFGSNIKKEFFVKEGVPVIRGNNLTSYRFIDNDFVYLTEEKADELRSSNCHPGDIVITHRGTLGQVGLIPRKSRFRRYVISQSGMKLFCDESQVVSEYVFYFLKSPTGQRLLLQNTSQTGVPAIAQPLTSLKNISIPIPHIDEQKRIVKVLDDLNDKIDLLEKQNRILEEIGKALFKHSFINFEFPNKEGKPYKSSAGEMVYNEELKNDIPKGWAVLSLGEYCKFAYGKSLRQDLRRAGLVPVYGSNGQVGWHDKSLVKGPGIVVGRKGNPGTITWVQADFFPIDTTFYVIPRIDPNSMHYLFHTLSWLGLSNLMSDSAVPGLNRNIAYMTKMLVPPAEVLNIFERLSNAFTLKLDLNNKQIQVLASLRDFFLPRLMSGKIRVPLCLVCQR